MSLLQYKRPIVMFLNVDLMCSKLMFCIVWSEIVIKTTVMWLMGPCVTSLLVAEKKSCSAGQTFKTVYMDRKLICTNYYYVIWNLFTYVISFCFLSCLSIVEMGKGLVYITSSVANMDITELHPCHFTIFLLNMHVCIAIYMQLCNRFEISLFWSIVLL